MAAAFNAHPYAELHKSPNGAGDARPTALQILQDNNRIGTLNSKTFLITGGTAGLGLETVRQLAKTGARVFFTARDEVKAKKVADDLIEEAKADADLQNAQVEWIKMDNASLKSVKQAAEAFQQKSDQLNVLTPYARTVDGFEAQFATNHLAHFYLFQLLRPLLLKSSATAFNSRVVTIASGAHAFSTVQVGNYGLDSPPAEPYDPITELDGDHNPMLLYGSSKTANIWMANEIDRRYGTQGLHGLSVHPGSIYTAGWTKLDSRVEKLFAGLVEIPEVKQTFKSLEQGAATQVLAAVGKDFEGKGGMYLDDCGVSLPLGEGQQIGINGYKPWAYDPKGEQRLWKDSLEMVGLQDDQ